jgi:hypothetical protein
MSGNQSRGDPASQPLPPAVSQLERTPVSGASGPGTTAPPFAAGPAQAPPDFEAMGVAGVAMPLGGIEEEETVTPASRGADEGEIAFPIDAFIIPEDSQRVPTGMAPGTGAAVVGELADRLARLANELRAEGEPVLQRRLSAGDRLDTVLAALLAGFVAGQSPNR